MLLRQKVLTWFESYRLNFVTGVAVVLGAIGTLVAWRFSIATLGHAYLGYQAQAFLHGRLTYGNNIPNLVDSSVAVGGGLYWASNFLPSLLLVPLVAIMQPKAAQVVLHFLVVPLALYLCYALARRRGYGGGDATWLALGFTFASVFLGEAAIAHAWHFGSGVGALLGLWFMVEALGKQRSLVLGSIAAAALATRPPVALIATLVFIGVNLGHVPWLEARRRLLQFAVPLVVVATLLMGVNFVRTGSPFDTGYWSARVNSELIPLRQEYGLFSWRNIPTNFYYYFLTLPDPVVSGAGLHLVPPYVRGHWAMSFWLLSPLFLYLLVVPLKTRFQRALACACGLGVLFLLTFYAVNVNEFGPRYLVDVLPFAYVLLLEAFPGQQLSLRHRVLIFFSAIFNFYLLVSMSWRFVTRG